MKTKQLIALAVANNSSNSKSVSYRNYTKNQHQFLIPVLTKSGNEITFFERFCSILKRIRIFN